MTEYRSIAANAIAQELGLNDELDVNQVGAEFVEQMQSILASTRSLVPLIRADNAEADRMRALADWRKAKREEAVREMMGT